MAGKPKKGGRYTPKASRAPEPRSRPSRRARRPAPATPQVGRRPSHPAFLFFIGILWLWCAVVVLIKVSASWKLIPAVVFAGVGAYYLRGALQTVVRRDDHTDQHEDRE